MSNFFADEIKQMTEKDPATLSFPGRVARFQLLRKRIHDLSEELDFAGSNFNYVLKNEADVRKRVTELTMLVRKLEETLGPESQPTNVA